MLKTLLKILYAIMFHWFLKMLRKLLELKLISWMIGYGKESTIEIIKDVANESNINLQSECQVKTF